MLVIIILITYFQICAGKCLPVSWKPVFVAITEKDLLIYDVAPSCRDEWLSPILSHSILATRFKISIDQLLIRNLFYGVLQLLLLYSFIFFCILPDFAHSSIFYILVLFISWYSCILWILMCSVLCYEDSTMVYIFFRSLLPIRL